MPMPNDEGVVKTADQLVHAMRGAFGTPESHRPAHARGRLVTGTFTPSSEAASLSSAPHFHNTSTPLVVRFSSSTGIPNIPDTDTSANPRGIAIRFLLSEDGHKHTDLIAHSTNFFPTRTGEGFLQMLSAIGDGTIDDFLQINPAAAAFIAAPKPSPASFATEVYYGVNAFKLVSKDGKETYVRYQVVPNAGLLVLSEDELKTKDANYLFDELPKRLESGPVSFNYLAQIAEEGDPTDDATKHWPEKRKIVELGKVKLDRFLSEEESNKDQKRIIYDPIPRVNGIEPSSDPLLNMRAAVYLISGKGRRAA